MSPPPPFLSHLLLEKHRDLNKHNRRSKLKTTLSVTILPPSFEMVDFIYQCTNLSFSSHTLQHISLQEYKYILMHNMKSEPFSSSVLKKTNSLASYTLIAGLVFVGQGLVHVN